MSAVEIDSGLIDAYRKLQAKIRNLETIRDGIRRAIEAHLQVAGADTGTVDGQRVVSWTDVAARRLDHRLLHKRYTADELAELYTETVTKRFVVHVEVPHDQ